MNPPLLQLTDYGTHPKGMLGIKDLSLSIFPGETHFLLGNAWSGLSQLAKSIAGLDSSDTIIQGHKFINGQAALPADPLTAWPDGVAYLGGTPELFFSRSVLDNLSISCCRGSFFARLNSRAELVKKARESMASLNIHFDLDDIVGELNLHQQKLIDVLRVLLLAPALLILGQPERDAPQELCDKLVFATSELSSKGSAILWCSESISLALAQADQLHVVSEGQLIKSAPRDELDEALLHELFTGEVQHEPHSMDEFCQDKGISEREQEVISFLIKGYSNKEIASKMFISINTVKTHISSVYQKVNVDNRVALTNAIFEYLNIV
jgi:ABC-type sugar transport system ATPase subunit